MRFIVENLKKGIQFAVCFAFLYAILIEILNRGVIYFTNWWLVKLFLGAVGVSLGYSLPSYIYLIKQIPVWVQVFIQLLIGTLVFILIGYLNDWLCTNSLTYNLSVILGQLFIAIMYLLVNYIYNVKLASKINNALKN